MNKYFLKNILNSYLAKSREKTAKPGSTIPTSYTCESCGAKKVHKNKWTPLICPSCYGEVKKFIDRDCEMEEENKVESAKIKKGEPLELIDKFGSKITIERNHGNNCLMLWGRHIQIDSIQKISNWIYANWGVSPK